MGERKYKAGDILYSDMYKEHIMVLGIIKEIIYLVAVIKDGSRQNLIASGVDRWYNLVA